MKRSLIRPIRNKLSSLRSEWAEERWHNIDLRINAFDGTFFLPSGRGHPEIMAPCLYFQAPQVRFGCLIPKRVLPQTDPSTRSTLQCRRVQGLPRSPYQGKFHPSSKVYRCFLRWLGLGLMHVLSLLMVLRIQGPLSRQILLTHGLNLRALFNGESCTVIGLCSFKIGSASTVKACILHSFGNGFTGRESEEATFNCLSFSEPNLWIIFLLASTAGNK